MRVAVFCASSANVPQKYFNLTQEVSDYLVKAGYTIVYGGGSVGLMGCLADRALEKGGKVIGILPRFMDEVEWGHKGLTELVLVEDMRERKKLLIENVDAVIALPGGCGTLEELMEVYTLKRLGKFTKPIIVFNPDNFYSHLNLLVEKMIEEKFMREEHRDIWQFVELPSQIVPAIRQAPPWDENAIKFAAV